MKAPLALLTGLLLGCSPTLSPAQEYLHYVLFDAGKMVCYDYQVSGNFPQPAHRDYAIKTDDNRRILLRTVKLAINSDTTASLDKDPIAWDAALLRDPEYIQALNGGARSLYLVEQKAPGVLIRYKVDRIAQWTETSNALQYTDRRHDFEYVYDKIYTIEDKNLSLRKDRGARLYFQTRDKVQCTNLRTFRSFSENMEDPYVDIQFVEGIGLYSMRTSGGGELKLASVNGQTAEAYLTAFCNKTLDKENELLKNAERDKGIANTGGNNPYAGSSGGGTVGTGGTNLNPSPTTDPKDLYGGTSTNPKGGIYRPTAGGGTTTGQGGGTRNIDNPYAGSSGGGTVDGKEFVLNEDPCKGVSPFDVNNPCNQRVFTNQEITKQQELPADGYYIAQQGDNLYKIANKFGTTTKILMCLNNKKDYSVDVMQRVLVVDTDGRCSQSINPLTRVDNANRIITTVHVVEQGEVLGKIAAKYGLTIEKLCQLNGLDDVTKNKIQIDQELIISVQNF